MKNALLLFPFAGLLVFVMACRKNNSSQEPTTTTAEEKLPTVIADKVSDITSSTANFFGKITNKGGDITDRGIFWGKEANPAGNKISATTYSSGGDFQVALKELTPNTTYYVRGFATNSKGTAYTSDVQFTTSQVAGAELFTDTMFAAGATTLFVAGKVVDAKGISQKETGVCISKNADPTINDTKVATTGSVQTFFLRINGLEPATEYYIRSYATNIYGSTFYGQNVKVSTIQKGNVTYTLAQNPNPTDEEKAAYARIKVAFDEAVAYYNNFTSITKILNVNYVPGVPTADAHINGTIRVGSNTGYQRTGTALHEIAHAVGVGQHAFWTGTLIKNGVYQGVFANNILRFMTRTPGEALKGDNLHFWPYGINGANEDNGQEMLYITNVLIMQGMKKDGLPGSY